MAEVTQVLRPESATFNPNDAAPKIATLAGTTGLPALYAAMFDPDAIETCFFAFRATRYGGGEVLVDVVWFSDGTAIGNVVWGVSLAAITPEVDGGPFYSETFATEQVATDLNLGASPYRLHRLTISFTGSALDSMATNDVVVMKVRRVATNGADTLAEDAGLLQVDVRYQDA